MTDLATITPTTMQKAPQKANELAPPPVTGKLDAYDVSRFEGGGTLVLTPEEQRILTAPLEDDEIQFDDKRQLSYAGHSVIRDRMNRALGVGAWVLRPVSAPMFENGLVLSTWDLYVRGHFTARATGEMAYIAANNRMTWGDAVEGSKSNALSRCAKDLGIGLELFNKKKLAARGRAPIAQPQALPPMQRGTDLKPPTQRQELPPPADDFADLDALPAGALTIEGDITSMIPAKGKAPLKIVIDSKYFAVWSKELCDTVDAIKASGNKRARVDYTEEVKGAYTNYTAVSIEAI